VKPAVLVSHAIVVPWPISTGLRTWCGYRVDDSRVAGDYIATTPEGVSCRRCAQAMRDALVNLEKWVPGLPVEEKKDAEGGDISAQIADADCSLSLVWGSNPERRVRAGDPLDEGAGPEEP
jgi:hypothetical protein